MILICCVIGLIAGLILAIIDRNFYQITAGFAGGVIAGTLTEYIIYIGVHWWEKFVSAF